MTDMGQADRSLRFSPRSQQAEEAFWKERSAARRALKQAAEQLGFEHPADVPESRDAELRRLQNRILRAERAKGTEIHQDDFNRLASHFGLEPREVERLSPCDLALMDLEAADGTLLQVLIRKATVRGQESLLSVTTSLIPQDRSGKKVLRDAPAATFGDLRSVIEGHLASIGEPPALRQARFAAIAKNALSEYDFGPDAQMQDSGSWGHEEHQGEHDFCVVLSVAFDSDGPDAPARKVSFHTKFEPEAVAVGHAYAYDCATGQEIGFDDRDVAQDAPMADEDAQPTMTL
jgi:hypothetical protein